MARPGARHTWHANQCGRVTVWHAPVCDTRHATWRTTHARVRHRRKDDPRPKDYGELEPRVASSIGVRRGIEGKRPSTTKPSSAHAQARPSKKTRPFSYPTARRLSQRPGFAPQRHLDLAPRGNRVRSTAAWGASTWVGHAPQACVIRRGSRPARAQPAARALAFLERAAW